MERFTVLALCFLCMLTVFSQASVAAERQSYHWYCAHQKGHIQPKADARLSFVEALGGYYLDHRYSDANGPEKVIYLTFDAGYENGNVAKILDVMREEEVTGAFFVLKNLILKNPELIARMAQEGHLVCNHTMNHRDMSRRSDAELLEELRGLESLYRECTGLEMARFYRPPEGTFSRENLQCAMENGYKTVFWSFAYPDWDNEKQPSLERARQIIMDNIHNGEVMLLHPTSAMNAAILQDVIRELKGMGYRFGTLEELTSRVPS